MGGRGTYARGNVPAIQAYKTVDVIEGVKVLETTGKTSRHGLPEESRRSRAYIKVNRDGTFREMRIYDKERYTIKDIAYHPEPTLNNGDPKTPILHAHDYPVRNDFHVRKPRRLTNEEYAFYKKFFRGVPENAER